MVFGFVKMRMSFFYTNIFIGYKDIVLTDYGMMIFIIQQL